MIAEIFAVKVVPDVAVGILIGKRHAPVIVCLPKREAVVVSIEQGLLDTHLRVAVTEDLRTYAVPLFRLVRLASSRPDQHVESAPHHLERIFLPRGRIHFSAGLLHVFPGGFLDAELCAVCLIETVQVNIIVAKTLRQLPPPADRSGRGSRRPRRCIDEQQVVWHPCLLAQF